MLWFPTVPSACGTGCARPFAGDVFPSDLLGIVRTVLINSRRETPCVISLARSKWYFIYVLFVVQFEGHPVP